MRIEIATVAALATVLASVTASATPSARLVYSRAHGAESCPDEQALRDAVSARVGYDPFFPWAKQTIIAAVAPGSSRGFTASVSLVDEHDVDHGSRTLSTQGECRELVDVAALAIAIAIDPRSLIPHPAPTASEDVGPPPPAPVTLAPAPRVEAIPEMPPRLPVETSTIFEGTVGAVVSEGVAVPPTFGGVLGAGVQRGRLFCGDRGPRRRAGDRARPGRASLVGALRGVAAAVPAPRTRLRVRGRAGGRGRTTPAKPSPILNRDGRPGSRREGALASKYRCRAPWVCVCEARSSPT